MPPKAPRPFRRANPLVQAVRTGLRDYAAAEDGGEPLIIRTWNSGAQRFAYTRAGRAWLSQHEVDHVALLPVRIEVLMRTGRAASWYGSFPVASLPQTIDAQLTRAREGRAGQAQVKDRILQWMRANGIGEWDETGRLRVVHQESDQRFVYPNDRPWRMSLLQTTVRRNGDVEESATLNEPVLSQAPWRYSGLLRVGDVT